MKYKNIKNSFKPTFRVSAYFNQKIEIQDNLTIVNSSDIKEITGSDCVISGTFKYVKENDENISLRLNGDNRILSVVTFEKHYTFILIMRKDSSSIGRLFNNSSENQLFGFWGNHVGSVWLNADLNLRYKVNDGKRKFYEIMTEQKMLG